jgi:TolA-binding protein
VKSLLSVTFITIWCVLAVQFAGCGNTAELEQSIADKEATIDRLGKEKKEIQAENARLKGRVGELEKNLNAATGRAAELQRQVDELRARLEREKSPLESSNMDEAYREALRMFMDRRYEDAIRGFEALLAAGIPDPLNDNCHYWMGESFFGLKRYSEALARFDEVLGFEWSNKKDDSQIMIARCHARMGEAARARQEYQKLIDVYPASPYVELARRRAGAM